MGLDAMGGHAIADSLVGVMVPDTAATTRAAHRLYNSYGSPGLLRGRRTDL